MVATKVRVVSRAFGADEAAHCGNPSGADGYEPSPAEKESACHGTDIILTSAENIPGENGETGESYDNLPI